MKSGFLAARSACSSRYADEILEAGRGTAGEHEDRRAHGVESAAVAEAPIFHRREEVLQPAQRLALTGRIELVPEDQRQIAFERHVADAMQGALEVGLRAQLRQVELERARLVRLEHGRQLPHREGLAGSWRAEDGDREGMPAAVAVRAAARRTPA